MRVTASLALAGLAGLAACGPAPYSDDVYSIERESELIGEPVVTEPGDWNDPQGRSEPGASGTGISREELTAAGIPPLYVPRDPGSTRAAASSNADPSGSDEARLSDEQDFDAVAERETIESDAARREAMQRSYQVIEPEPLPERRGEGGPNIVAYAINTPNRMGEQVYSRSGFNARNRFNRNCAEYETSDAAQRDFLARGGPQEDPRGLDPDGDGFACFWDPGPFRTR